MCGKILVLDDGPDKGRELECVRAYPPVHLIHHNTVAEWFRISPTGFMIRYFEIVRKEDT